MAVVVGKDDGLADTLSALHLQTVLHQVLQHTVDGVEIEDVIENLFALNISVLGISFNSLDSLFILPHLFELFLFFRGEVIVLDALFQDERTTLEALVVDKIALGNGILQLVGIVGHTLLHLERLIGATVYLIPRCCGQAHKQAVKIVKDG